MIPRVDDNGVVTEKLDSRHGLTIVQQLHHVKRGVLCIEENMSVPDTSLLLVRQGTVVAERNALRNWLTESYCPIDY